VATVTYVEHDGTVHAVTAEPGISLMQVAVENLVPGINADCGGACRCATCLCYVDEAWLARLDPPSEDERLMLEGSIDSTHNGRLTCQIQLTPSLDGIRLQLPES
jgi:2Fe-2S ferredoxin